MTLIDEQAIELQAIEWFKKLEYDYKNVQKSMALGYVPIELSKHGTILEVEINGKLYKANVTDKPLYDANGGKMKS